MLKLDFSNIESVTSEQLAKLINYHKIKELPKFKKMSNYYNDVHDYIDAIIAERKKADDTKPNHKLISNYPQYIVDMIANYLVGSPVTYSSNNTDFLNELQEINTFNYEQEHNAKLAKSMGIYGVAYELLYLGKDGLIYFTELKPENTLVIETADIDPIIGLAINYYEYKDIFTDSTIYKAELYWPDRIEYWSGPSYNELKLVLSDSNEFGEVPVVVYSNNDLTKGDFEPILSLIDDLDLRMSDMSNELDFFSNAMLIFDGVDPKDLQEYDKNNNPIPIANTLQDLKRNKAMIFPPAGPGESTPSKRIYFVKPEIDNTANTNQLNLLIDNIHKFSKVPNLNDEKFASNSSGVALKYKLLGLEQIAKGKERKFKKGLVQRIELITNIMQLKSKNVYANEIIITFTRSLPVDLAEIADMVGALKDVVSEDTLLSNLPMVTDVEREKQLKAKDGTIAEQNATEQDSNKDTDK